MKLFVLMLSVLLLAANTAGHAAEDTKKKEEPRVRAKPGTVPRHQGLIGGEPPREAEKPFGYPGVPQRPVHKPRPPQQPAAAEPQKPAQSEARIKR